jgi:hypothetical protein
MRVIAEKEGFESKMPSQSLEAFLVTGKVLLRPYLL